MIGFEHVSVSVEGHRLLDGVDLELAESELTLVVGPTGAGKSTLLRCVNGLVPHFSGGTLSGRVTVAGRDTATHRPRDLADVVGFVAQDPASSFVTDTVEEELAYGMETLGVGATAMRRRVEETLDLLGVAGLRGRALRTLSGGQQQRVAIGAVLAAGPRVLVLDEPTSALDPVGAEDVLSALHRLVHDVGLTVVLAEHRLERVVHHADAVVLLDRGRASGVLDPAEAMTRSPVHPPVVALGRSLGWAPLPLSVRDARRRAAGLRTDLAGATPARPTLAAGEVLARTADLRVEHGHVVALDRVGLELRAGEVVALMGRNGSGKSTLLDALTGRVRATSGQVRLTGPGGGPTEPARARPADVVRRVGLVPQDPTLVLYAESVAEECRSGDRDFALPPGTTAAVLERVAPGLDPGQHPRDLSEGQRLSLALALVLAARPPLLLLDEPTRGLDYPAKARLVALLRELVADGHGVVVATHDVELAAEVADRAVLLAEGTVVADDRAETVLAGSPALSPQVARVMHPLPLLTVDDVTAARAAP